MDFFKEDYLLQDINSEDNIFNHSDIDEDEFGNTIFKTIKKYSMSSNDSSEEIFKKKEKVLYESTITNISGNTFEIEYENDINNFISNIQQQVIPLYNQGAFDDILSLLNKKLTKFFEGINYYFYYIIHKLMFFKLLKTGNERDIKKYYFDCLLKILKEVKPKSWKEKDSYFQRIIIKPGIFLKDDILEKYYEQFMFELDKAIRRFLADDSPLSKLNYISSNIAIWGKKSYYEDSISKNEESIFDKSFNSLNYTPEDVSGNYDKRSENNENNQAFESNYELDISDRSTKEEFSDFEDEFTAKFNEFNNRATEDEDTVKSKSLVPNINQEELQIYPNEDKTHTLQKSKKSSNKTNLLNIYRFKSIPKNYEFKPKFIKKEIINKKIIRNFCNFVKSIKDIEIGDDIKNDPYNYLFFQIFISGKFLPPLQFQNPMTNEYICFKSFNDNYLYYIFSKFYVIQFYQIFISQKGYFIFEQIISNYSIDEKEEISLKNYIMNLYLIYDINNLDDDKKANIKFNGNKVKNKNVFSNQNVKLLLTRERSRDKYTDNMSEYDINNNSSDYSL